MDSGLLVLTILLWKHAFVDLFLQTFHTGGDKTLYIGKSHRHYIEHGFFTFVSVIFFTSWPLALALSILDYIIHWHVDYSKSKIVKHFSIDRQSRQFWRLQAIDQFLHYSTYAGIVFILLQQ